MTAHTVSITQHVRRLGDRSASDAVLLDRFVRRADREAFAALVERHGPMVFRLCRRALGNAHDAEDAFQATFLVLARRAAVVRPVCLTAWLFGVARRVARKARAAPARRLRGSPFPVEDVADSRPDPLASLTARELVAALDDELGRLPEAYRLPVTLCCLEGLSQEEAARRLGWTPGSVKGRLERGRRRLFRGLVKRGLAPGAALAAAGLARGAAASLTTLVFRDAVRPAALAGAVLRGMLLTRLTVAAALLAAALAVTAAGLTVLPRAAAEPLVPQAAPPDERPRERLDAFGDLLPPGAVARLGTVRFRQGGGYVNRLLLSPDGKTLVSKSYYGERSVAVWNFATGRLVRQFPGHYEENRAVALSPDGKTLVTGQNTLISFHDLATGREIRQLNSPVGGTDGLAFAPDGKTLASGHGGRFVQLWDLPAGTVRAKFPAQHNRSALLAFSPDGKTLATGDTLDPTVRLFDAATGEERHQLKRTCFVHDFAFAPDGKTLAAGAMDGVISLWDPATGKLVRELRSPYKHVRAVAWAPDGKTLAASEYDEKGEVEYLRFWDPAAGKSGRHIKSDSGLVESLAFTADGKTLVSGGRRSVIRLWDAATGEERSPRGHRGPVWCLAVSPDGKTLAYSDKEIRLFDLAARREAGTLPGHHWSFAFSPDGRTLAGGSGVNAVNVWDVAGRRLLRRPESDPKKDGLEWVAYYHVAYSPDGKQLAGGGRGVTLSQKGDSLVRVWDADTGNESRLLRMAHPDDRISTVEGLAYSPDGKTLAASGRAEPRDGKVRLWDAATGKELVRLTAVMNDSAVDEKRAREAIVEPRVVFSADGRLLARNRQRKGIPVWEAATGRERCQFDGHDGSTVCVAFAPDGRTLASSGYDATIRLWDVADGKELRRLTGHRGKANALAFTPDGATLISGGDDTTVLFWDVAEVTRRARPAESLAPGEWAALWADLAGSDAVKAHRAMARLTASSRATLTEFKERLRPSPVVEAARLAALLRDLDADEFAVREKAENELARIDDAARAALERERDQEGNSAERRRRLDSLLAALDVPSGERLRELRAVEVLERIGGGEARRIVEELVKGAPESRLTREAKATAERLKRTTRLP